MNTLRQVQQEIEAAPQYWSIHLMDFVDDFRYYKDIRMIEQPIIHSDEVFVLENFLYRV